MELLKSEHFFKKHSTSCYPRDAT